VHDGVNKSKNFGDELVEKEMARCHIILYNYMKTRILESEIDNQIKELKE
jgi:hypothetical protein